MKVPEQSPLPPPANDKGAITVTAEIAKDGGRGVFEVTVRMDQSQTTTRVRTSPRHFAVQGK